MNSFFDPPPNYTNTPDENNVLSTHINVGYITHTIDIFTTNYNNFVNIYNTCIDKNNFILKYISSIKSDETSLYINIVFNVPNNDYIFKDQIFRFCEVNKNSGVISSFKHKY